jgi:hypothetical protein
MNDRYPELSSLATNLHELVERISALARASTQNEAFTTELYEIERTITNADRRLQKLITRQR